MKILLSLLFFRLVFFCNITRDHQHLHKKKNFKHKVQNVAIEIFKHATCIQLLF